MWAEPLTHSGKKVWDLWPWGPPSNASRAARRCFGPWPISGAESDEPRRGAEARLSAGSPHNWEERGSCRLLTPGKASSESYFQQAASIGPKDPMEGNRTRRRRYLGGDSFYFCHCRCPPLYLWGYGRLIDSSRVFSICDMAGNRSTYRRFASGTE